MGPGATGTRSSRLHAPKDEPLTCSRNAGQWPCCGLTEDTARLLPGRDGRKQETGHSGSGAASVSPRVHLDTPRSLGRGSLECSPWDPVEEPGFHRLHLCPGPLREGQRPPRRCASPRHDRVAATFPAQHRTRPLGSSLTPRPREAPPPQQAAAPSCKAAPDGAAHQEESPEFSDDRAAHGSLLELRAITRAAGRARNTCRLTRTDSVAQASVGTRKREVKPVRGLCSVKLLQLRLNGLQFLSHFNCAPRATQNSAAPQTCSPFLTVLAFC